MQPRLANKATGCGGDLMRSELTVLGKVENDRCQPNARVFSSIDMMFELGRHGCPHLVEDFSEHPQTIAVEHHRADRIASY